MALASSAISRHSGTERSSALRRSEVLSKSLNPSRWILHRERWGRLHVPGCWSCNKKDAPSAGRVKGRRSQLWKGYSSGLWRWSWAPARCRYWPGTRASWWPRSAPGSRPHLCSVHTLKLVCNLHGEIGQRLVFLTRLGFYTLLTRLLITVFIHSQDTCSFSQQLLHYNRKSVTSSDVQWPEEQAGGGITKYSSKWQYVLDKEIIRMDYNM